MALTIRPMRREDAAACTDIVNDIIARGGTTAYEKPYTVDGFDAHYRQEPPISMVALNGDHVVGFQAVFEVEPGLYSIGTFTDRRALVKGAGTALFDATLSATKARGGTAILARITSDNTGGLAFYSRMGFADFDVKKGDLTRSNGTVVDRIIKRFPL